MANTKFSSEIRSTFLNYFEKHGHTKVASSSLIPENDPTLLFANAGMNQFKNLFLGLESKNYVRAASSQKCVRAGGKHNDLENVGFTARHHTFFEMLGNFSFGDYFKKDAIHFAWELLTKEFQIPREKLYVTVHHTDDEAAEIWHKQEGVPKDRIFKLGDDNFWRMGDTGPCGPCTEIFYDHGERAGKETDPYKGIVSGEDRFVEIWNLVFMQFFEKSPGDMIPLPKPSVDTGSGLERVTAALQGKLSNYDTDLFWPLIVRSAEISKKVHLIDEIYRMDKDGIRYQAAQSVKQQIAALRVVADHVRSSSFLIADGAIPSNEGRGYVLRRILRRAIRFSQMLSEGRSFLPEISEVLINHMSPAYPELKQRREIILQTLKDEEQKFETTLSTGTTILTESLSQLKSRNQKILSGDVVFKLYDTYGFPVDLTKLMATEQGFQIDEAQFEKEMSAAKEKAKASWKGHGPSANEAFLTSFADQNSKKFGPTKFVGYSSLSCSTKILTLASLESELTTLTTNQTGLVILSETPVYAEGGGQAADQASLVSHGCKATILDCKKINEVFIHTVHIDSGELKISDVIEITVTSNLRKQTAVHHSATHLLHAALRKVLGTSVAQAGQMVDHEKIRFDFTYNKALTDSEISEIECLVNNEISNSNAVTTEVTSPEKAKEKGAMALFGEKYGNEVRVLTMGDFSKELCGGTHVSNTSEIRIFKVVSESGVSSGIRRIEALAGDLCLKYFYKHTEEHLKAKAAAGLNEHWQAFLNAHTTRESSVTSWIESKKEEIKSLQKEIKKSQVAKLDPKEIVQNAKLVQLKSGVTAKLVVRVVEIEDREVLSQTADHIKNLLESGVIVLVGKGSDSHSLLVSVTKNLNPAISAGNILKSLSSQLDGKGGGRPDFAQGSITVLKTESEIVSLATDLLTN